MNTVRMPHWRRACRVLGARLFDWAENNGCSDPRRNGEAWLVGELMRRHRERAGSRPFVVFDAGANAGDYTAMVFENAAASACEVEVHAFEPSAAARARLAARFGDTTHLRIVGKALGERAGRAVLHGGADGNTQASLAVRPEATASIGKDVEVEVAALADYLEETRVERVDLLKLDVEGFELAALRGLGEALRPERVGVVQFEYGGTTLDAGASLRALFALLMARGYRVAKLLPRGIEPRNYASWMEHFRYANYVAWEAEASR